MSSWQFTPIALLYLAAVIISLGISLNAWRLRPARGAYTFSVMALSSGIWSLGYLLGFFNADPTWKMIMLRVEYFGAHGAVMFWLWFVASYTHNTSLFSRRAVALLSFLPSITFLLVLTVPLHNFFYISYDFIFNGNLVLFVKDYGPGFYLWLVYAYSTMIGGAGVLIRGMFNMPEKFRSQIILLILVILLVLFPNLFYVIGNNPLAPYDPTCLTFVLVGILLIITMRYFRFLDVLPVAHDLVFNSVKNGVIIVDERTHIQELNPAAAELLNSSQGELLGKPIAEIFTDHHNLINNLHVIVEAKTEIKINQDRFFELQITPIINQSGEADGRIIMFYEISDRKKAEDELRRQVSIDPLTGVLNRRYFFTLAEKVFNHTRRLKRDLAILMVDIDDLKKVNQQHGHAIGDLTLVAIVNHLKKITRPEDILGRLSGEEFVVLMPEVSPETAEKIAGRLHQQISGHHLEIDNIPIDITISIGAASIDFEEDYDLETLIVKAEKALYGAKQAGYNQTLLFDKELNGLSLDA